MRKVLLASAVSIGMATPLYAGTVDDAVTKAKDTVEQAAGAMDRVFEFADPVFSTFFGLVPLGAWFEKVCAGRCEAPTHFEGNE